MVQYLKINLHYAPANAGKPRQPRGRRSGLKTPYIPKQALVWVYPWQNLKRQLNGAC